jgi:uncharacterized protein YdhG (YjbR/CyaY superfamily)
MCYFEGRNELDEFQAGSWQKGSLQFPLDKPLPAGSIKKMVRFRIRENLSKAAR